MPNKKISDFASVSYPIGTDLFYLVRASGSDYLSRNITLANALNYLNLPRFIPAVGGNIGATAIPYTDGYGVELDKDSDSAAGGVSHLPSVVGVTDIDISAVIYIESHASGVCRLRLSANVGDLDDTLNFDIGDGGYSLVDPLGATTFQKILTASIVDDIGIDITTYADPIINVTLDRDSNNAADTFGYSVWCSGFLLEYTFA